jgi:hypothetical protein
VPGGRLQKWAREWSELESKCCIQHQIIEVGAHARIRNGDLFLTKYSLAPGEFELILARRPFAAETIYLMRKCGPFPIGRMHPAPDSGRNSIAWSNISRAPPEWHLLRVCGSPPARASSTWAPARLASHSGTTVGLGERLSGLWRTGTQPEQPGMLPGGKQLSGVFSRMEVWLSVTGLPALAKIPPPEPLVLSVTWL